MIQAEVESGDEFYNNDELVSYTENTLLQSNMLLVSFIFLPLNTTVCNLNRLIIWKLQIMSLLRLDMVVFSVKKIRNITLCCTIHTI